MKKSTLDSFINRNSLIPLIALESSPLRPAGFSYSCSKNQIEWLELDPVDFYFNPSNNILPYTYYRGFILLELADIDTELAQLKDRINSVENKLNAAVAQRDFANFLSLIDARLAPDLFMEVFDFIPDTDKYPLFTQLFTSNQLCQEVFTADFIKNASKYKGVTAQLPRSDEAGFVQVFMSQPAHQQPPHGWEIWNTDINQAIINALQFNPVGDIYQGLVHIDYIQNYLHDKLVNQVTVEAFTVEKIKQLDLIELHQFMPVLQTNGIIARYFFYVGQIKNTWFHNPQGIHALSHTKRVLLLVLILAYLENCSEQDTQLLCQAAIYHDIGRKTDGYDTKHGFTSYRKVIDKGLADTVPPEYLETLRFIIENHAVADRSAWKRLDKYQLEDMDRCLQLYNIFKDADGLDRVRINDLNSAYLRTASAQKLLLAAHQLYRSEEFEQMISQLQ